MPGTILGPGVPEQHKNFPSSLELTFRLNASPDSLEMEPQAQADQSPTPTCQLQKNLSQLPASRKPLPWDPAKGAEDPRSASPYSFTLSPQPLGDGRGARGSQGSEGLLPGRTPCLRSCLPCRPQVKSVNLSEGELLSIRGVDGSSLTVLANHTLLVEGQVIRSPTNAISVYFRTFQDDGLGTFQLHYQGKVGPGLLRCSFGLRSPPVLRTVILFAPVW